VKILSITAGAAGMYCGSCARDNSIARELLARGHDVTLMPVYTPTRTDEPNASRDGVLFGGISVYLQQYLPLVRKLPRVFDRIWDSPRVIGAFAGRAVSNDPQLLGELTVSMLEGESGALGREFDKLREWLSHEPAPDVVNLPNSLLIALAAPIKRELNRPVCVTLQGEELFIDGLQKPYRSKALEMISRQARHVDRFIAVSDYCAKFMPGYLGIPADRVSVVRLGIDTTGYDARPRQNGQGVFRIGYFARIAPEKGLAELAAAYIRFRRNAPGARARLEAAGYAAPAYHGYLEGVRRELESAGLGPEFVYRGVLNREEKLDFLGGLDVLSVPATYDEPKGLFLLEAMARGTPVIQPRRGAFIEIVEKTGGGLLVEPDDPESLAGALHALWRDSESAAVLGRRARAGVDAHYTVGHSASALLDVFQNAMAASRMGANA
jgi:glycosyltransferase involved in cell wall biosynthesis